MSGRRELSILLGFSHLGRDANPYCFSQFHYLRQNQHDRCSCRIANPHRQARHRQTQRHHDPDGVAPYPFPGKEPVAESPIQTMYGQSFSNEKAPDKQKIMGCEKAEKTDFIVPNPANTQSPHPNKAVTGNGMGSVIHITTTHVKIAAKVRAASDSVSGRNTNIRPARSGATNKPNRCGECCAEG